MRTKRAVTSIMFALLLLLPAAARAQQKGVELTQVVEKEVVQKNADNKTEVLRTPIAKANILPGDVVVYTFSYENKGDKPGTNVAVKNAVPEHMVYVDGSAEGKGARIEFSVDNGKTYAPAGKLKVRLDGGKERPAAAADYNFIRWVLEKPIAKGAKGSVSFKAKVK